MLLLGWFTSCRRVKPTPKNLPRPAQIHVNLYQHWKWWYLDVASMGSK